MPGVEAVETTRWNVFSTFRAERILHPRRLLFNGLSRDWLCNNLRTAEEFQRPYDFPDLFVSVLEFCIAGTMAVILNYFFQRQRAGRVNPVKSSVPTAPVEPTRVVLQAAAAAAMTQAMSPVAPPAPVAKPDPVTPPAPVTVAPAAPAPFVAPAPGARPVAVAPPEPPGANSMAAKPLPPAPKPSHPS